MARACHLYYLNKPMNLSLLSGNDKGTVTGNGTGYRNTIHSLKLMGYIIMYPVDKQNRCVSPASSLLCGPMMVPQRVSLFHERLDQLISANWMWFVVVLNRCRSKSDMIYLMPKKMMTKFHAVAHHFWNDRSKERT